MKMFTKFLMVLTLALGISPLAFSQGGAGFDLKAQTIVATDFNLWKATTRTTVAAEAATITLELPALPTIPGWGPINPFFATNSLLIDAEHASVAEEITITSSSCTTPSLCTITATFANAHSGQYTIRSGSYGINEAIKYVLGLGGGEVIVPADFGGVTADITAAIGSASVLIRDLRAGIDTVYGWNGSTYASRSVINVSFVDGATGSATDRVFFIANRGWTVTGCSNIFSVTAGGASKLQVVKDTGTDAPGAGTDLLTNNTNTGFDLAATANTVQVGTLTATAGALVLATGNRLSVDYANAIQSTAGNVVTCTLVATS